MSNHRINYTFKLKLTVLSPLAINSGLERSPLSDYFVLDGLLYYVDPQKLQKILLRDKELQRKYESKIFKTKMDGADGFLNKLIENREKLKEIANMKPVPYKGSNTLLFKEVMKSNGQPYIPGSSIKGAIKNAVLYYWLTKVSPATLDSFVKENRQGILQCIKSIPRLKELQDIRKKKEINEEQKKEIKRLKNQHREVNVRIDGFSKSVEGLAFGVEKSSRDHEFILRQPAGNLKIRDSDGVNIQNLEVANVSRQSLKEKVWDLHTQEYIKPGTVFVTDLQISELLQDWVLFNRNHFFTKSLRSCTSDLQPLISILSHFANVVINIQSRFNIATPDISVLKNNEALLFLGSGKGIYRSTVLMAIRNHYEGKGWNFNTEFAPLMADVASDYLDFPNSISHINNLPLGWVKLTT